MTPTVVITRPKGDEAALADALHAQGYHVIHEPLTEIVFLHDAHIPLALACAHEPDAIIATSRHGVAALSILNEQRDVPLLCVGQATAAFAQACGFTRVSACGGNAERLAAAILHAYDEGSRFVYVSARHIRPGLEEKLAAHGMRIERVVAYEAAPATALSDTLAEQLRRGQIDAVTFFSPRNARIFIELATRIGLMPACATLHAVCLSEAVAAPLRAQAWRGIAVAGQATLASLVACVNNTLRSG